MSKRHARIALILALSAAGANAETVSHTNYSDTEDRVLHLGESGLELFRPEHRAPRPFDLNYLTHDLRSKNAGLGLRLQASQHLAIHLEIDPFTRNEDLIGPLDDIGAGATILGLRFSF